MSFIDIATLTMHRRMEMESRINSFDEKCDRAISDIKKLKMQGHSFLSQLNCEPAELKERFLNFMKKLDEYTYLITDFNLALGQIEDLGSSEYTPVQDSSMGLPPPYNSFNTNNLMDALSEPVPSTSCACTNLCPPEKPKRVSIPKEEQVLISFSSSSTSSESVPINSERKSQMAAKEDTHVQCSLTDELATLQLEESSPSPVSANLPAQAMLDVEHEYFGVMTAVSGGSFWIIVDDSQEFANLMLEITEYYKKNDAPLTIEQMQSVTYCAMYDDESNFYYRALYIKEDGEEPQKLNVFLVDTGEMRACDIDTLRALTPAFAVRPPYAHYCHLAGINPVDYNDKLAMKKYEDFIKEYLNVPCSFYVDENESESAGVYVTVTSTGLTLNDMLVDSGLAEYVDNEKPVPMPSHVPSAVTSHALLSVTSHTLLSVTSHTLSAVTSHAAPAMTSHAAPAMTSHGPPELAGSDHSLSAPEYDDPVEAVTGYHNRDEADICKHYKGGPDKTCFKGSRCTKKHVTKHPDGWTLDRVEVVKIKPAALPTPKTWVRVQVTAIPHFDTVYVNVLEENPQPETLSEFGVVLPPMTLAALVREMNSDAAWASYKPLKLAPAPGEMVAALYPPDGRWYRACVRISTRADQSVEVQFIDYGTDMWIKEDQIRILEPRFAALPAQAVRCVLAGVFVPGEDSRRWARALRALQLMLQDKIVHCHVIARDFDEITVDLVDEENYSVSQQLAAQGVVELREYSATDDAASPRLVVP